jgi:hypothetical protein
VECTPEQAPEKLEKQIPFDKLRAGSRRLNRLLKKWKRQIPPGLKLARDDKVKELLGTTDVVP